MMRALQTTENLPDHLLLADMYDIVGNLSTIVSAHRAHDMHAMEMQPLSVWGELAECNPPLLASTKKAD